MWDVTPCRLGNSDVSKEPGGFIIDCLIFKARCNILLVMAEVVLNLIRYFLWRNCKSRVDCDAGIKYFKWSCFCNLKKIASKGQVVICRVAQCIVRRACVDHADKHFVFQYILVQSFAKPTSGKQMCFYDLQELLILFPYLNLWSIYMPLSW